MSDRTQEVSLARMAFTRRFDLSEAIDSGFPGYRVQILSHLESALILNSNIEEGGCGPGLHYHRYDQMYYLIEGSMTVQLGSHVEAIEAGTFVFIPAGLAHRNWNEGPGAETHFEVIVPAPSPLDQIALFVDHPDDVPSEDRCTASGYTRSISEAELSEPMPGMRLQSLAAPRWGSRDSVVNYMELGPGSSGPGTHIHHFDQYYLVLEGQLTVEVALEKYLVPPRTVVVLPAGVPHRQYNEGPAIERHLTLLSPAPELGSSWDRGVDFAPNGDDVSGPEAVLQVGTQ